MSKSTPRGWHSVTPRIVVHDPSRLIEFLKDTFFATGEFTTDAPSQMRIGDSIIMSHVGWDALPAGLVSLNWGTQWLRSCKSLVAEVPSIVVPDEFNVLINPSHPGAAKLIAKEVRRWNCDARLI
jgi:hypothetical protein